MTRKGHYWPSANQLLLLQAGLLQGSAAADAWTRWRAAVDFERLDIGSERLLPLAVHNLARNGVRDLNLGRYAGILHYTLVTNRRRLARLRRLVEALGDVGIPAMLLKGIALARCHYEHAGLRPMDDVDLLVRRADVERAVTVMHALGWRGSVSRGTIEVGHSQPFNDEAGCRVDLHWHALREICGPGDDEAVWMHAEHADLDGTPVRVLAPHDLMLEVVVHGARWSEVPPVRWVADAATIVYASGRRLDWERLVSLARTHALVLPLRDALSYLEEAFGMRIPSHVSEVLRAHRPSRFERVEQRIREWTSPRFGCFPLEFCQHLRVSRGAGAAAVIRGLPRHLQHAYDLPSPAALPAAFAVRAARRLGGRFMRRA